MQFKAIPKKKFILLSGDLFLLLLSVSFGFFLRLGEVFNSLLVYAGASFINITALAVIFYVADLYNLQQNFRSIRFLTKVVISMVVGIILVSFVFYFLLPYRYGRGVLLTQVIFLTPFIYLWRILFHAYFQAAVRSKNILLMGKDWVSEVLYEELQNNSEYKVLGLVNGDVEVTGNPYPGSLPIVKLGEIGNMIRDGRVDGIALDLIEKESNEFWESLLKLKMSGLEIISAVNLYQELTGKIPVHHVNDRWFVYTPGYALLTSNWVQRVKLIFDLAISFISLILLLPFMGLIALAIKLESSGPIFYKQGRLGKDEQEFQLIKFRSMIHNAEEETGAVWAQENDSRVTRVGKYLRLSRVDELPQLINVLKGEMSFIGPRPERSEFVKELKEKIPYYSMRHSVKPGITGWAQVNYPYGASVEDALEKVQYDLFYIQNMSLLLEVRIFLKSIQVVLLGKGSR
jgi:sugar transferase (PEP-CTERM system associated)